MGLRNDIIAVAIGGGALLLAGWYAKKKAAALATAVNPADRDNVVNQAATGFYQTVTGSTGTIGGDIYDATHDNNGVPAWWWNWNMLTPVGAATVAAKQVAPYVNPADSRNVVNLGATSVYRSISGSTGTIGGDLYDWLH